MFEWSICRQSVSKSVIVAFTYFWFIKLITETSGTSRGGGGGWSFSCPGSVLSFQVVIKQGDQCGNQQQDHDDRRCYPSCIVSFRWSCKGNGNRLSSKTNRITENNNEVNLCVFLRVNKQCQENFSLNFFVPNCKSYILWSHFTF